MKHLITLILLLTATTGSAQWSNNTNQFYDDLHTPVSNSTGTQKNPIVLNSYPDGGYFVIWEDERNIATTNQDIYAQKYDAAGNRLWAINGVPVANGPNAQRYVFSSNQDYRNRSFAATDSAGGFYIGYVDDSVNNYSWERIAVQHMRSNGSAVFPGAGNILEATPGGQNFTYSVPLLVPDGNKGFYLSFSKNELGQNQIYVFDFKDENGILKYYGGGRVTDNAIQRSEPSLCGVRYYLDYPTISIQDYNIWYDGQGGCHVIMAMNGNGAGQGRMLGYNRIWRAKKNSRVKTFFRNTSGVACPQYVEYKKDEVYPLYTFSKNVIVTTCGTADGQNIYVVTSEYLKSNGYQLIDIGGYDYNFPKGTTVFPIGANINVDLIAVTKRTYTNNTVSPFAVLCYAYQSEKYDSVPFQRASFGNPDIGFNPTPPVTTDQLVHFRDTILASGNYYPDFSFTSGGTSVGGQHIYAAALMSTTGDRAVRLQHLTVEKRSANTFAVKYETNTKYGEVIGREINTGFGSSNINYDFPLVKVDEYGRAMFYIREYYRSARVSPIRIGAELAWGAMGRPVGTGLYNNSYYNFEQPVVALHPLDGSGVIAWRDNRNVPGNTGENIFMHHLDSLSEFNYAPPYKPVKAVPNPYGGSFANPAYLAGSSKAWSLLEVVSIINNVQTTGPLAEIKDDHHLGVMSAVIFQNRYALRSFNNVPYLDRNYTIKPERTPPGPNLNIGLRLFFTTEEFDILKLADNAIQSPADLIVIRQPNTTTNVPDAYTPIAGEEVISPSTWKAVPGGYYLQLSVNGFGNFFVQKPAAFGTCPGGNATLTSNLSGSNYQWQVNAGSGFANINNNANYNGTNSVTLQLNAIPATWYGYQYRCVVDGVNSNPYFLKFTATWTGAVNNNWENASNWGCGAVPDANTDVVINSGTIIVNANASCRSLTVKPGAAVTVKPGVNLDVMK